MKFKKVDMDIRYASPSAPQVEGSTKWDQIVLQGPLSIKDIAEKFRAD